MANVSDIIKVGQVQPASVMDSDNHSNGKVPINGLYFQEIEFTPLEEFEFWLSEMEDKLVATTAKKPGNRVEACQLLATGQKLQG